MAFVEKVGEVWRCEVCGNVVEVKEAGGGGRHLNSALTNSPAWLCTYSRSLSRSIR